AELQRVLSSDLRHIQFAFIPVGYVMFVVVGAQTRHFAGTDRRKTKRDAMRRQVRREPELRRVKAVGQAETLVVPTRPGHDEFAEQRRREGLDDLAERVWVVLRLRHKSWARDVALTEGRRILPGREIRPGKPAHQEGAAIELMVHTARKIVGIAQRRARKEE